MENEALKNMFELDTLSDRSLSVDLALKRLFVQASEAQVGREGSDYVGALLQHLVGAKLDLILGGGIITHHSVLRRDVRTVRNGEFEISGTVIHVTAHPRETLFRKISGNLASDLKPVLVTTPEGFQLSKLLLRDDPIDCLFDIIDVHQFLVANVYLQSLLNAENYAATLERIICRYNEIVDEVESDPQLRIQLPRR